MGSHDEDTDQKRKRSRARDAAKLVSVTLMGVALAQELRKPKEERTWQGALFGWVPYDLRPPTPARVKASVWSPDDERVLLPRAFGVGWSPNVGRVVRLVRQGGDRGR
ncbi:hypothetical protein [Nocardioides coralli]|uniref:hypothetical protein n=1 Tax=Nocardioides coralli TaxID=2872154 RepID=UPI001CA3EBCF|nr:hypothetical protein [Nocardioides coralli]QZY29862.1 hypothetical protein K6T13_04010 [Nocardioides coralli]